MGLFKKVKVVDVRKETEDTVSVAFELRAELENEFTYKSGQYITIKKEIEGQEVRRSYSLSSAPHENEFRIAIKKISSGLMSSYFNKDLKVGDELEVMSPQGSFVLTPEDDKHYVGFVAGSGITPVISMVKTVMTKTNSKFTLYYGNKSEGLTIFKNELNQLKKDNDGRFNLNYIYSQQESTDKLFEGRIGKDKFNSIIKNDIELLKATGFYLCGPEQMIMEVSEGLEYLGVGRSKIHYELFTVPVKSTESQVIVDSDYIGTSNVTVIMDGDEVDFQLASDGNFILDAAMENGVDAPFSCKGAVCCTCKAQVIEGKAIMDMNYSLSDAEVEEGFILTCQAHPASDKLVVDFDVI
jgi:ring-1,2-phenylacetyl-CoA epoxidase subunit PaaE